MKPHYRKSRLGLLAAAWVTSCLSGPTYVAAQEIEVKQPDSAEFVGAAGVELPVASSFEELEARQQASSVALTKQVEPAQVNRTAARGSEIAPRPSAKPEHSRKQKNSASKSKRRKSVALAPLPKTKPKIIPIEEILQPSSGEDEPPLVEVVDDFSELGRREFDDSARR